MMMEEREEEQQRGRQNSGPGICSRVGAFYCNLSYLLSSQISFLAEKFDNSVLGLNLKLLFYCSDQCKSLSGLFLSLHRQT